MGRRREVASVIEPLCRPEVRLVTLTGPGGVGRKGSAVAVAREAAAQFGHGARFVGLAPIADPDLVASAIASRTGYGINEPPRRVSCAPALTSRPTPRGS